MSPDRPTPEDELVLVRERQRSVEAIRMELLPALEELGRGECVVFDAEEIKRHGREG